jgi:hypothetical protein
MSSLSRLEEDGQQSKRMWSRLDSSYRPHGDRSGTGTSTGMCLVVKTVVACTAIRKSPNCPYNDLNDVSMRYFLPWRETKRARSTQYCGFGDCGRCFQPYCLADFRLLSLLHLRVRGDPSFGPVTSRRSKWSRPSSKLHLSNSRGKCVAPLPVAGCSRARKSLANFCGEGKIA